MTDCTNNYEELRAMSIEMLECELEELEWDYKRKFLSTNDYNECTERVTIVLKEKRQEQNRTDAFKRAMVGI